MRLKAFRFRNLFSLGKGEVDLDRTGILLIRGRSEDEGSSNGAGKSSLANKGIIWTLYGQTASGIKGDAVINRHTKKKTATGEIEFEKEGRTYRVTRKRPNKLTLAMLEEKTGEWHDISEKKASETQSKLDGIIGLDFQAFVQTHLFGQGRRMSYPALPPAQQKAVLSQLLPLDRVQCWADFTKDKIKELKSELDKAERVKLQAEAKATTLDQQIENNTQREARWLEEKAKNVRAYEEQIRNERERVAAEQANINALNQKIATLEQLLPSQEEQDNLAFRITEIYAEIEKYQASLFTSKTNGSSWMADARHNRDQIKDIESGNCPTCTKPITDEALKQRIVKQNEEHRLRALESEKMFRECQNAVDWFEQALTERKRDHAKLSDQLASMQYTNQEINKCYVQIKEIERKVQDQSASLTAALNQELATECPYFDTGEELYHEAETHAFTVLEPAKECVAKLSGELEHLEYWRKVYAEDLQRKLFEFACPFLAQRTAHYLSALGNPQLQVEFSTVKVLANGDTRDDFNVHVRSSTGGEGYDNLSGGEQQIVSFAVGLALGDLSLQSHGGAALGFQILDEPFTMLDERNAEHIVDFLTRNPRLSILISNEDQLSSLVPQVVSVRKRLGVTEVL